MDDSIDDEIREIEACDILEMLVNFIENAPADPTKAQLQVMVGLLQGGIEGAIETLGHAVHEER